MGNTGWFLLSVHIIYFWLERERWGWWKKNEIEWFLTANHTGPLHMPFFSNGQFDVLSKSMQKIPTKFFGNPVKTKSELLYLHYQVFREWGKARCSGKHKGIRSMKQGSKNRDYSSWSITSFARRIRGSSSDCTEEEGQANTIGWPTHPLPVTRPGLLTRTNFLTEDNGVLWEGSGACYKITLSLCCGTLYLWEKYSSTIVICFSPKP